MKLTTSRLKKLIREAMEDEMVEEGMQVYAVFDPGDGLVALFSNKEAADEFLDQKYGGDGYVSDYYKVYDSYDSNRQY